MTRTPALAAAALAVLAAACGPAPSQGSDLPERRSGRAMDAQPSDAVDAATDDAADAPATGSSGSTGSTDATGSAPPAAAPAGGDDDATAPAGDQPAVPAWHAVVDREMPYFSCTGGGTDFQVVMDTTDAIGILADNTNVEGTVTIDAGDHPVFAVGSLLNGTATNETFGADMLLSFEVGNVSCTALAYEMTDGFDAGYSDVGAWDDCEPDLFCDTWSVSLGQYGQMVAEEDFFTEGLDDDTTTDYAGVYFIDGGVIHAALIGDGNTFVGTVDPDHTIWTNDGDVIVPSAS